MYDILIIGAGPAGLSAAIEATKAGLSHLVLDKGSIVDSIQRWRHDMHFFSTPELLEIGGIPFVIPTTRPTTVDAVNYYRRVTEHFHLNCRFFEPVTSVTTEGDVFRVATAKGTSYPARAVVVATGYYDTPTHLNVPGEDLPHVAHYYRDPLPYFQQDVLIIGGKNSAVEAALDLYRHGARVTVVHRGEKPSSGVKYWILPDFENRVAQGAITFHTSTTIERFEAGETVLRSKDGACFEAKTDFAFVLIGYLPDVSFFTKIGVAIDPESLAPLHNPETMETNIPNLFIAGGLVGGKFNNKVFIENGREHGKKIVKALVAG